MLPADADNGFSCRSAAAPVLSAFGGGVSIAYGDPPGAA